MSTEKKKEQQLLEDVTAQPAVQSSYSTAGLNSRKEVVRPRSERHQRSSGPEKLAAEPSGQV